MKPDADDSNSQGARRTQAERTAHTRARLLRAGLELIAERGYERASIAAIGERAGYSRGVVTHTFGSKAGLLTALVEQMFDRWGEQSLTPAVKGLRGADALCAAIDSVREQARERPTELKAFYLLLFEALGPLPELRPAFRTLHARLRTGAAEWIEAGMAAGDVRQDIDPQAQAALYIGAFRGVMYQWLLDPEQVDLDRLFEEQKRGLHAVLDLR